MEYIKVTGDNVKKVFLCRTIPNSYVRVSSKKPWFLNKYDADLMFLKSRNGEK